jgi:GA-binding protein transcription factor alpha
MTKREAEELIEIEIDGTEKPECTEERLIFSEFIFFFF